MYCCNKQYPWWYRYYPMPYPIVPNYPEELPTVFIRDGEVNCWFAGVLCERHIDGLVFQYDKGLRLNIRGLDTEAVNEIQFGRKDTSGVTAYTPEIVDPLADQDTGGDHQDPTDPVDPTVPEEPEETEIDPMDLPYLSVSIPDELLLTPGTIVAYCVYHDDDEFRTVKTIYITVHERQAVNEDEPEEEDECACADQIAALQETIDALTERITALEGNNP